jgi:hypothetical protein
MASKGTINYKGFKFEFDYLFFAGRPATMEDPEEYPEWEIYNITLNGIDADSLLDDQIDEFEKAVVEDLINENQN